MPYVSLASHPVSPLSGKLLTRHTKTGEIDKRLKLHSRTELHQLNSHTIFELAFELKSRRKLLTDLGVSENFDRKNHLQEQFFPSPPY